MRKPVTPPTSLVTVRSLIAHTKQDDPWLHKQLKAAERAAEKKAGKFARATGEEVMLEYHKRLLIASVLKTERYKEVRNWLMGRIKGRSATYARRFIPGAYKYMRIILRQVLTRFREQFAEYGINLNVEMEVSRIIVRSLVPPKYRDRRFDILISEAEKRPVGEHDIEIE